MKITKVQFAFDSLTLSRDFIDDTDGLITVFNDIIDGHLFSNEIRNGINKNGSFKELPLWFDIKRMTSIQRLLIAHFEVRIQYL